MSADTLLESQQAMFAKHLFIQGYPLWNPDPPPGLGGAGLRIGDVGTVDERGGFDVFFNILDSSSGSAYTPPTFSFPPISENDVRRSSEDIAPQEVVSSPGTTWDVDQLEAETFPNIIRKKTQYSATLRSDGSHVILPQGAQLFELGIEHQRLFEDHARQHAADWLERYNNRLGAPRSNSLYLLTGFYKTCSWSLASISMQMAENSDPVRVHCTLSEVDEQLIGTESVWQPAGRFHRKIGPPLDRQGQNNQSIFIRAIVITPQLSDLGGNRKWTKLFHVISAPVRFLKSLGRSSKAATTKSKTSHPSEIMNQYLLAKVPSARFAVTHDSQWMKLLGSLGRGQSHTLRDLENDLEALLLENCSISTDKDTVFLRENDSFHTTSPSLTRLPNVLPSNFTQDMDNPPPRPIDIPSSKSGKEFADIDLISSRRKLISSEDTSSMGSSLPTSTFYSSLQSSHTTHSELQFQSRIEEKDISSSNLPSRQSTATSRRTAIVRRKTSYASRQGAFADVWECDLVSRESCRLIGVKAFKLNTGHDSLRSYEKRLRRELLVWGRLEHRNVVPLLGTVSGFGPLPSIVSPWFRNGPLSRYLILHKFLELPDKHRLLRDISAGLSYLHSQDIIHGDLHSDNVLIDDNGAGCLIDFGLSFVSEPTLYLTSSMYGSVQFADPALVRRVNNSRNAVYPTMPCDVYSFGGLMLHVLSCKKPYEGFPSMSVFLEIMEGGQAMIPTHEHITPWYKSVIQQCWDHEEHKRPLASELEGMFSR